MDATEVAEEVASDAGVTASQQPVGETEIVETPAELVGDDPQQTVDNSTAASIVNATSPPQIRTVLVDSRINFVQSIRQLTSVLRFLLAGVGYVDRGHEYFALRQARLATLGL